MSEGLHVLVVDDEVQIRRFLKISLEANGYTVYENDNGQDALVKTAQLHPDLVILDIGLPDMNGIDVLSRLREWDKMMTGVLSHSRSRERTSMPFMSGRPMSRMTKSG